MSTVNKQIKDRYYKYIITNHEFDTITTLDFPTLHFTHFRGSPLQI